MQCKICSHSSNFLARARIVRKYDIDYFKCPSCGFVQTEAPYWLAEVYANPLQKDTGTVRRNLNMAQKAAAILTLFFNPSGRFLDFGGGDGMFVRHMRDIGYDFYWCDKYATNIFAFGFNATDDRAFELVTSFEVFEHLPDPLTEIEAMLARSDSLLFSTNLYPDTHPKPDQWGYFSLHGGQHIALYSLKTLHSLAERFHRNLYSDGHSLHLLTTHKLPRYIFPSVTKYRIARMITALRARKSLTDSDHALVIKRMNDKITYRKNPDNA